MAVVMAEFEELCASFTEALEKMPYEALLAMDSPKYQAPLKHEIYEKRTTP